MCVDEKDDGTPIIDWPGRRVDDRAIPRSLHGSRLLVGIVALGWDHESQPNLGILNRLAEDLADRLRTVRGTEMVRLYGAPDEQLTVLVDAGELNALGLDASAVARLIAEADSKHPAGVLRGARSNVLLEVDGEIDSIARVESIPLVEGDDQFTSLTRS